MQNARAWNKRLAEAVRTWKSPNGEYAEEAPRKRPPDFSNLQAYRYINRIKQGARTHWAREPVLPFAGRAHRFACRGRRPIATQLRMVQLPGP